MASIFMWIYLLVFGLSWFLALVGISAVQDVDGIESYDLSLQWFVLLLQLALIVAIAALWLMGRTHMMRNAVPALLAIVATLWLQFADTAYKQVRGSTDAVSDGRLNTLIAGACLLFFCDVAGILMLSTFCEDDDAVCKPATPPAAAKANKTATSTQVPTTLP